MILITYECCWSRNVWQRLTRRLWRGWPRSWASSPPSTSASPTSGWRPWPSPPPATRWWNIFFLFQIFFHHPFFSGGWREGVLPSEEVGQDRAYLFASLIQVNIQRFEYSWFLNSTGSLSYLLLLVPSNQSLKQWTMWQDDLPRDACVQGEGAEDECPGHLQAVHRQPGPVVTRALLQTPLHTTRL